MTDPTTPISAVAEALEAATPGPWHANVAAIDDWGAWVEVVDDPYPDGSPRPLCDGINRAADAHLIANAPTWLAQLLAALEEAHPRAKGAEVSEGERGEVMECPCGTWIEGGFDANGTVHECMMVDAVARAIYERVKRVKTLTFDIAYPDEQEQFRDVARIAIRTYRAITSEARQEVWKRNVANMTEYPTSTGEADA